jgi:phasin family protein
MQSVAKRQVEILRQTMDEAAGALKDLASSGSPQDFAAKEAEMLRQTFQKALTHMRELAEMVSQSNTAAFDTINNRISDSLAEVKAMVTKLKQA